ncbi:unnamed protein product [Euphydryas editha]|uniref:Uncharacterized protein n=1 Tax=Euphydryas editha TaxID=104508 RepID=A0AAU9TZN8_EUPED|nr:unnamed protein product [Euphydryas editha]
MYRLILTLFFICTVNCQLLPVIYSAPSAVSHQSQIHVKHSSNVIATPLVYSPVVYATYPSKEEINGELFLTPVVSDAVLTPIALTLFHNMPLARALEHPIQIGQGQDSIETEISITQSTGKTIVEETTDNIVLSTQG